MLDCIVCTAFDDHKGPHYTAKEVSRRLFSQRVRSLGRGSWVPLPNCTTLEDRQVFASAHMTDDPHAHMVDGVWLCASEEPPDSQPEAAEEAEVAEAVEAVLEPEDAEPAEPEPEVEPEPETARPAPAPQAEAKPQSGRRETRMAESSTHGCLEWAPNGLEVKVRSRGENGAPGVEDLKAALSGVALNNGVKVQLTESLGDEEAWVTITTTPRHQGSLLMCAGMVVDMLTQGGVYEEVLLTS